MPGRGADFALLQPATTSSQELRPAARFPATLAILRVQGPSYDSLSIHRRAGDGKFSIVTVRDIETDADYERLARLPQVRAIASFTRQTIPGDLDGADALRRVGADLHADIVLAYTFDTRFHGTDDGPPLESVTLGPFPTPIAWVESTASALWLDTRTGYVHDVAGATSRVTGQTSPWWTSSGIDAFRRSAERTAFELLLVEIERSWNDLVAEHASAPSVEPPR